eukprot:1384373-Pyramimonas_sp.AAC.1
MPRTGTHSIRTGRARQWPIQASGPAVKMADDPVRPQEVHAALLESRLFGLRALVTAVTRRLVLHVHDGVDGRLPMDLPQVFCERHHHLRQDLVVVKAAVHPLIADVEHDLVPEVLLNLLLLEGRALLHHD